MGMLRLEHLCEASGASRYPETQNPASPLGRDFITIKTFQILFSSSNIMIFMMEQFYYIYSLPTKLSQQVDSTNIPVDHDGFLIYFSIIIEQNVRIITAEANLTTILRGIGRKVAKNTYPISIVRLSPSSSSPVFLQAVQNRLWAQRTAALVERHGRIPVIIER